MGGRGGWGWGEALKVDQPNWNGSPPFLNPKVSCFYHIGHFVPCGVGPWFVGMHRAETVPPSADGLAEAAEVGGGGRCCDGRCSGTSGPRDQGAGQSVGGVKKDVLWRSPNWAYGTGCSIRWLGKALRARPMARAEAGRLRLAQVGAAGAFTLTVPQGSPPTGL